MTAISSTTGHRVHHRHGLGASAPAASTRRRAGPYTLSGNIAAATDKDLPVATVELRSPTASRTRSTSGCSNTARRRRSDAFVVEDRFPRKFVRSRSPTSASSNAIRTRPVTLYARNTTTAVEVPVGGSIAYKSAGAFTALPPGVV